MNRKPPRHLHPGVVAAIILAAFLMVQYAWWRGLVYRPPGGRRPPPGGGGGPGATSMVLPGRPDIIVDTFSGDLLPGDTDGPGHSARFDRPAGVAVDLQGAVYVADTGNHRIRKIAPDTTTTTLAGSETGYQDGPAASARFNAPCGVCAGPDGAVYVADTGNRCIRRIFNGQVSTIAGIPTTPGAPPNAAGRDLILPTAIAYLPGFAPRLLVTDSGSKKLLRYRLDGSPDSQQALPGAPTAVCAAPGLAIAMPQAGTLSLGGAAIHNLPIEDQYQYADPKGPFLRHPVGVCPYGAGWLATDSDHGAVFFVRNGKADVLAGRVSLKVAYRGESDGDGAHCDFSVLAGIAADGKKYAYVADTNNNCIRRLTLPDFIGR